VAEFRDYLKKVAGGQAVSVWLNLESGEREAEGFGTRIASIEVSSKAGEGRSVWMDEKGEALQVLSAFLADAKRPKVVHDPKLLQILGGKAANIRHATQIYSYLLRPTTANHNFADVVMRQFNAMLGGAAGERADYLHRLAPALRAQIDAQELQASMKRSICRWPRCWRTSSGLACASIPRLWTRCRWPWKRRFAGWKRNLGDRGNGIQRQFTDAACGNSF